MRLSATSAVAAVERSIERADAPAPAWPADGRARAATRDPVVLVPGYAATSRSWSAIARGLERDGFRVHVFEPHDRSLGSIEPLARQLDTFVEGVLAASDGARAVQVVGHSKGGLVAAAWLRDALDSGEAPRASRLVTLGTPIHGLPPTSDANPALAVALAVGGPSSAAILQTEAGSRFITELQPAAIARRVPTTAIFTSASDGLVHETAARIRGAANVALGRGGSAPSHMGLLTDAGAYDALRGALLGAQPTRRVD